MARNRVQFQKGPTQFGNRKKTFVRDTLAPLIGPGVKVYDELKCDILGNHGSGKGEDSP